MTGKSEIQGTPTRKSARDARQGLPGRPVLKVLIAGTLLGSIALLVAYLLVDNPL